MYRSLCDVSVVAADTWTFKVLEESFIFACVLGLAHRISVLRQDQRLNLGQVSESGNSNHLDAREVPGGKI